MTRIGVDIGGSKTLVARVGDAGHIEDSISRPTISHDPAATIDQLIAVLDEITDASSVSALGICVAGLVAADHSTVLYGVNIGWRDIDFGAMVRDATGVPVVIENDATAAAWGEFRFGAGRGSTNMVLAAVGTGIGGGIVANGELVRGANGVAGEIGHIAVEPNGRQCGCGRAGCLEQYTSGTALVVEAKALAGEQPDRAQLLLALGDGTVDGINGPDVTAAARQGDPVACEAFERIGYWLGHGLADVAVVTDPDRIVIGGGVSDAGEILLDPVRRVLNVSVIGHEHRPRIDLRLAELGNFAGLIGAVDLVD